MKFFYLLFLFTLVITNIQAQEQKQEQEQKRIVILHTNDLHSRLNGYSPESAYTPLSTNDNSTAGGFTRIAGVIKSEKKNLNQETMELDAGNFLMGTLFPALESETGFQLRLMKQIGYDAAGLGIHEFDYGPGWLTGGMLFDRMLPGTETAPDIFRVTPLGFGNDNVPDYPLARLYVTGKELKNVPEVLQVAYNSSPGNYCYYSGIRVEYNHDKRLLKKISMIDIIHPDGRVINVDFDRKNKTLYSVAADSYMLEFIGVIKK